MGNTISLEQVMDPEDESVKQWLAIAREEFDDRWENYNSNNDHVSLKNFDMIRTVGAGGFGRVLLSRVYVTKEFVNLKIEEKETLVKYKQVARTLSEKKILSSVRLPMILALMYTFKDATNVYFVSEYVNGGEMFGHLRRTGNFPENQAKFYSAQVVMAIEYLHTMDVMYRDLKPENILLDVRGYIKLTDFVFAKRVAKGGRAYSLVGTPQYFAPELILAKAYNSSIDWWQVGVLTFEMASGYPPFYAAPDKQLELYEKIIKVRCKFPKEVSADLQDFCRHLMHPDLTRRYGNLHNGVKDIMEHKWFENMDWVALYNQTLEAPFVPLTKSEYDTDNFDDYEEEFLYVAKGYVCAEEFADF